MKRLKIGLDFRPALSRATGVGRYFQGLVSGLGRVDHDNDYVLFSSSWKERPAEPEAPMPDNFELVDRRVPVRLLNALWHRAEMPSFERLAGHRIDIGHSPTPMLLPTRHGRSIVTICDLFFLERPDATGAEIRRDYGRLVRSHAQRADAILAISETTAKDVVTKLNVAPDRVHVVPAGVDERFLYEAPSSGTNGDDKNNGAGRESYLLAVATIEPRKNLVSLLRAIALLKKRGWDGVLRVAGSPGLDVQRFDEVVEELGIGAMVQKLGYVHVDKLRSLYRGARAVVSPSLWEGFGLPLLEAMASRVPLVASDIPVHREVAGDAASFAAPLDSEGLADAIERVWSDDDVRQSLVSKGVDRVSHFSWEDSARKAVALYRLVGG